MICYECIFGGTPFYDENNLVKNICEKVLNYKTILLIPHPFGKNKRKASSGCIKFMRRLLCDCDQRMKLDEIKTCDFFNSIDFEKLSSMTPPIIPGRVQNSKSKKMTGLPDYVPLNYESNLDFIGYTYNHYS